MDPAPRSKGLWVPTFVLHIFYYCLLTISAHKGPWTIRECKMDTAQIDSVTSHRHVWIMRFGCSLSHSKHISVTDLLKTWWSKVSFLREDNSCIFFFFYSFGKKTNLSKLGLCNFKCGKSWNWHRADPLPLSLPKKGGGGKGGRWGETDANIVMKLEGSSEMLINFRFPKESCVFLWVSTTVKRHVAKSIKQEKMSFWLTPPSEIS